MKKEELIEALRALAKKHPRAVKVGYMWKNPLNPRSIGRRRTPADIKLFRKLHERIFPECIAKKHSCKHGEFITL
jgi:hypothetical protein